MTDFHDLPDWYDDAACLGADADLFFPTQGGNSRDGRSRTEQAREICAGCPVIVECLAYAQADKIPFGIWGGTSPRERMKLRTEERENQ